MPEGLPGLTLAPACVGMAVAWTWVVATLFVGQELAMHDTSQSCMLGGVAAALALFALLDLADTRGPELNRSLMRALSCLVAGIVVVDIYLPGNPSLPAPLIVTAWTLLGVFGAYAIRRSFHLLASLAARLDGRSILRVTCACLAGAAVLGLMASNMPVQEAAVVMIASVPVALWLLPQGRLVLGGKRRHPRKHAGDQGAGARPASGAGEAGARPAGGAGSAGDRPASAGAAGKAGNRPAGDDTAGDESSKLAGARPADCAIETGDKLARSSTAGGASTVRGRACALQTNAGSSNDVGPCTVPAGNAEASAQSVGCESMQATLAGIWPSNSEDARPQPTDAKCVEKPGAAAYRHSSLPLKQLAPSVPAWQSARASRDAPSPPSRSRYRLRAPAWRSRRFCSCPTGPTTSCGNSFKTCWCS